MTVFSGVRCEKIKDLHHLQIIENHGKRLDSSRERINKKLKIFSLKTKILMSQQL